MSRETAITEKKSYATDHCDVCSDEVAVDEVPEDVVEPQGYAVLLGEGTVTRESEDAGNWDEEVHFELEKEESRLPTVSAHIICENCAEAVHGVPQERTPYTGRLPSELTQPQQSLTSGELSDWIRGLIPTQQTLTNEETPDWTKELVYLVGAVLVFIFLLSLL